MATSTIVLLNAVYTMAPFAIITGFTAFVLGAILGAIIRFGYDLIN